MYFLQIVKQFEEGCKMMQSENTSRIKKKKGLPSGQAKQVLRKGDFATRIPTTANVITVLEILPIQ